MSELFMGLVTHARSRFNIDGAAAGQLDLLAEALHERQMSTATLVSDRDDFTPAQFPLTRADLVRSAAHVATLEHRWRRFLAQGGGRPHRSAPVDVAAWGAMVAKGSVTADRRTAIRLLNIDLSHLRVMDAAVVSGAPWTLILEDDARVPDVDRTAEALIAVMEALSDSSVQFVSLSESLPHAQLGVEGLLHGRAVSIGPDWLVAASLPVTNTVCANLYRTDFVARVAEGIRRGGLVPVTPIDWRLNEQIMRMWALGELDGSSCVWAIPGLFLQGSMHGAD